MVNALIAGHINALAEAAITEMVSDGVRSDVSVDVKRMDGREGTVVITTRLSDGKTAIFTVFDRDVTVN
jgi:hypothetical protein